MEARLTKYILKEHDNRNSLIDKHRAVVHKAIFENFFFWSMYYLSTSQSILLGFLFIYQSFECTHPQTKALTLKLGLTSLHNPQKAGFVQLHCAAPLVYQWWKQSSNSEPGGQYRGKALVLMQEHLHCSPMYSITPHSKDPSWQNYKIGMNKDLSIPRMWRDSSRNKHILWKKMTNICTSCRVNRWKKRLAEVVSLPIVVSLIVRNVWQSCLINIQHNKVAMIWPCRQCAEIISGSINSYLIINIILAYFNILFHITFALIRKEPALQIIELRIDSKASASVWHRRLLTFAQHNS